MGIHAKQINKDPARPTEPQQLRDLICLVVVGDRVRWVAMRLAASGVAPEAQLRDRRDSVEHGEDERENRNAAVRARRLRDRCR